MAFSWKSPHFLLKLIVLILLILNILTALRPSGTWGNSLIIEGLTNTSTVVILTLIITIIFFESPKTTEICLIISVLVMLIISCCLWWSNDHRTYILLTGDTVPIYNDGSYVVFTKETERRNVYLALTINVTSIICGIQKYLSEQLMTASVLELVKNYRFVFKLIELILALACLGILIHEETYLIPRWLWLIYCTNSLTYIVILIAITGCYVIEENCEYLDLVFSFIGAPLYSTAALSAIIRTAVYIPADAKNDSNELPLGIISLVSASLMISQIVWSIYTNYRRNGEETQ